MKILVSIPVYDNKLQMQSVACLLTETMLASASGVRIQLNFMPSCSSIAIGRNQLVKEFLASDADKLVFLDADVTFEPGALLNLALHPVDFVGGAYRLKTEDERYPVHLLNEPRDFGPNGLVEVAMLPTGFLALSRKVFEKFEENHPNRHCLIDGIKSYCFFQMPYVDGNLYTEDSYFCKEWREMGGKIYLDPKPTLTHWKFDTPYRGNFEKWAMSSMKEREAEASL